MTQLKQLMNKWIKELGYTNGHGWGYYDDKTYPEQNGNTIKWTTCGIGDWELPSHYDDGDADDYEMTNEQEIDTMFKRFINKHTGDNNIHAFVTGGYKYRVHFTITIK